jgi:hypothetical protein
MKTYKELVANLARGLKSRDDFAAKLETAVSSLASRILENAFFVAAANPAKAPAAVSALVVASCGEKHSASLASYQSTLTTVIAFVRAKGMVPTFDGQQSEAEQVAQAIAAAAAAGTLRKLYDTARAPKVEAAADKRAERKLDGERAASDMRDTLGAAGATLDDKAAARLSVSIGAFMQAAAKGDTDARAVLNALGAAIQAAQADWQVEAAAQAEAEAAPMAAAA